MQTHRRNQTRRADGEEGEGCESAGCFIELVWWGAGANEELIVRAFEVSIIAFDTLARGIGHLIPRLAAETNDLPRLAIRFFSGHEALK